MNWKCSECDLGHRDDIPDVNFQAFLRLIHTQFTDSLDYTVVRPPSHVPADPDALWYPISARNQGSVVDSESIEGLLDKSEITRQ